MYCSWSIFEHECDGAAMLSITKYTNDSSAVLTCGVRFLIAFAGGIFFVQLNVFNNDFWIN
jgi:hypothetical protein